MFVLPDINGGQVCLRVLNETLKHLEDLCDSTSQKSGIIQLLKESESGCFSSVHMETIGVIGLWSTIWLSVWRVLFWSNSFVWTLCIPRDPGSPNVRWWARDVLHHRNEKQGIFFGSMTMTSVSVSWSDPYGEIILLVKHPTSCTQLLLLKTSWNPQQALPFLLLEDMEEKKPVRILEMLFLKVLYKDRDDRNADGCWWYQFYLARWLPNFALDMSLLKKSHPTL